MILINDKHRCEHCFSELGKDGVCTHCFGSSPSANAMREGTILMGRYIVGMNLYEDELCDHYMGLDANTDERIIIHEFFPKGLMSRNAPTSALKAASGEYGSGSLLSARLREFQNDSRIMSKLALSGKLTEVKDLFEENNTSYAVVKIPDNAVTADIYVKQCGGSVDEETAVHLMRGMIGALAHIHNNGAIHGNLRPENIIIDNGSVMLTAIHTRDFACSAGTGPFKISNPYAPPEQYQQNGRIGAWTDIFSLGYVMNYLLTGNVPESAVSCMVSGKTPLDAGAVMGISVELGNVLRRMSEASLDVRYGSLEALCEELDDKGIIKLGKGIRPKKRSANSGAGSAAAPVIGKSDGKHKKRIVLIAVIIGIIVIAAASVWLGFKLSDKPESEGSETTETVSGETENGDKQDEQAETEPADGEETGGEGGIELPETTGDPGHDLSELVGKDRDAVHRWINNSMMNTENSAVSSSVLGNDRYNKEHITEIEFRDSFDGINNTSWDVSEKHDGSVKAWVTGGDESYKLYIGAEGGINGMNSAKNLFAGYKKVGSIAFNGSFHTEFSTDMGSMFKNCKRLKKIDLSGIDTISVKDMSCMFENCTALKEIRFGDSFKTSNVTSMSHMFDCCFAVTELDVRGFDTKNVTNMSNMFYKCLRLHSLDLSGFDLSNVNNMSEMFSLCGSLTSVDFGSALPKLVGVSMSGMFDYCYGLTEVKTGSDQIKDAYKNKK